jgi:hypothetical protein
VLHRSWALTLDPPLLTEAIVGFRTWAIRQDGRLEPVSAVSAGPWDPGVNVARCARGHAAPQHGCTCGIYAFHTIHRQLRSERLVGAIGAWGDTEVYRDGFRAGRARILALSSRGRVPRRDRRALVAAAERYGVSIVPWDALQPYAALRTGQLPASLLGLSSGARDDWVAQRRGYDSERQLWVEPANGTVTVTPSEALLAWLGGDVTADAVGEDTVALRLTGAAGTAAIDTGIAGGVLGTDGAAVTIAPSDWARDLAAYAWGPAARMAMLGAAQRGREAFADLLEAGMFDPAAVTSWHDVLEQLRSERERHKSRYASAPELYDDAGIALGRALAADTAGREHLARLQLVLALEVTDPQARLVLDLRSGPALTFGSRGPQPDVTAALAADDLEPLLAGRLDLARETRSGRIRIEQGDRTQVLVALSVVTSWSRRQRLTTGKTAVAV